MSEEGGPQPDSVERPISGGDSIPRRIESLAAHRPREARYIDAEQIGRGGMGEVWEVWDDDLRRRVAKKIVRPDLLARQQKKGIQAPNAVVRLLDEAQITGQLQHPGVVPVHELGVDESDRAFFTMQMVEGRELDQVIELARAGRDGWTTTRVLDCLLKVCDTVGYAHAKGVIHRDLKPSNVMVGEHGEVYVMDWGLAKVLGRSDPRDLGWNEETLVLLGGVQTDRADSVDETPGSPLLTRDGTVIGTPSYMPPEQAFGHLDSVGPHSDVYAVGAMLYQVLTGCAPYVPPRARMTPQWILHLVSQGPPTPVAKLEPGAVPELVAICEKAMSRDPAARYPTMREMAQDLRNYLEHRVVLAYQSGAWAEFKKWVSRNRAVAASLSCLLLVAAVSAVSIIASERSRAAMAERELVEQQAENAVRRARELLDQPIHPDTIAAYGEWLEGARSLAEQAAAFRSELDEIRSRADDPEGVLPAEPADLELLRERGAGLRDTLEIRRAALAGAELAAGKRAKYARDVPVLEREIDKLDAMVAARERNHGKARVWSFGRLENTRKHARLMALVRHLEELDRRAAGWIDRIERRLQAASGLAAGARGQSAAWTEFRRSVRDPSECPAYAGMPPVPPQLGLVPLGMDTDSGLWEFWHVLSGERPQRIGGRWRIEPETGLVMVLVPSGEFVMGASPDGATHPDAQASTAEGPEHAVTLAPYFLSKYEMTQEQWFRLVGTWPSNEFIGASYRHDRATISPVHPVEFVSWDECTAGLARWNLRLPTEAEWERAARGGSVDPWAGLAPRDINTAESDGERPADGYVTTAPVQAEVGNDFGFHRMLGNVSEWCQDWHVPRIGDLSAALVVDPHGLHVAAEGSSPTFMKSLRGGSWVNGLSNARVTVRWPSRKEAPSETVGLRPACSVVLP